MALPSSGQISFSQIAQELNIAESNVNLRNISASIGLTTPDSISEFYGYSSVPSTITNGIYSYHKFDETSGTSAFDSSGNGRTAYYRNGALINQTGVVGTSTFTDGTDDFIDLPVSYDIHTVNFWFKPVGNSSTGMIIAAGNLQDVDTYVILYYDTTTNQIAYNWRSGTGTPGLSFWAAYYDGYISLNQWHNISIEENLSNNTLNIYLNNTQLSITSMIRGTYNPKFLTDLDDGSSVLVNYMTLGLQRRQTSSIISYVDAYYDNFVSYDRVLTNEERTALYSNGNGLNII